MAKPNITAEIIQSQKEFEVALNAATKRLAELTALYDKSGAGFMDNADQSFREAMAKMRAADKTLLQGIEDVGSAVKSAKELNGKFDMIKRKAREAEDYFEDMQEQADKAEKAAKAAKGDKDLQKKFELAAKALEKAKYAVLTVKFELDRVETACKDPMNVFDACLSREWSQALVDYAIAIRLMRGNGYGQVDAVYRALRELKI